MTDLHIIQTVGSLRQSAGGPSRTVIALCAALAQHEVPVDLFSPAIPAADPDDDQMLSSDDRVRTTLVAVSRAPGLGGLKNTLRFGAALRKRCQSLQHPLLHDNGLWRPLNHTVAGLARQLNIPLMITPHGMLEPWAMQHKAWKKRLAWQLYQRRDLASAAVLHATAEQEAVNFRRLGLRRPIAIIPNGTDLPEWRDQPYPKGTPRKILFLSRIHPVKGLLNLVQAWRIVRPAGWQMVIAGPNEGGHQQSVEAAIRQAGLQNEFVFTGTVDGAEKTALYRSADLFVLPTFTENFGLVIAEALAVGVPVITTKGAPWEGLQTHDCGWWIEIGVEPLVAALREAINLPPETLRNMGQRGRAYVERDFGWPGIAEQMRAVYQWMLGRGDKPDCVMRD